MSTASDLDFTCECGAVAGRIVDAEPSEGDHIVCHCTDCQDFARYLKAEDRILDATGGTSLFQSRCARMRLQRGKENLACLHLTAGKTLRWYASCCNTPMFNTYANGRLPYVTTLLPNCDPARSAALLGPPIGHLFVEEATGDVGDVPRMSMNMLLRRFFVRMIKDIVSGDRRRSELFDGKTLEPIAKPYRLTEQDRRQLGRT